MSDDELMHEGEIPDDQSETPPLHDVAGGALGALTPEELAELRAESNIDPQLWNDLASMEETVAELARLSPTQRINRGRSAGIRSRLVSRAAASRGARTSAPRAPGELVMAPVQGQRDGARGVKSEPAQGTVVPHAKPGFARETSARTVPVIAGRPAGLGGWQFLAAASLVGCLATGSLLYKTLRERDSLRTAVTARSADEGAKIVSLQGDVAKKDSMIASLTGPNMRVVDLVTLASQDPVARMFWDRKTQQWTMYAYNLRQPKPGKTFQVWLIAAGVPAPISAGTFHPDAKGAAVMHASYPMDRGALQKVAISEEPDGGMPSPTGPIILAGR